jgi:hypothetical protein
VTHDASFLWVVLFGLSVYFGTQPSTAGFVAGEGILKLRAVPFRADVYTLLDSAHGGQGSDDVEVGSGIDEIRCCSAPRLNPCVGWAGDYRLRSILLDRLIRSKIPVGE